MEITDFEMGKWEALSIVKFPHPMLKTKTKKVEIYDQALESLVKKMLTSMYQEPGCGLAANQVGINKRLFVTDTDYSYELDENKNKVFFNLKPRVFINPRLKATEGKQICEEGCLSFPHIAVKVSRYQSVEIEFEGLDGQTRTLKANDFFADCLQHENDHLDGITFFDRVGPVQRQLLTKKFLSLKKRGIGVSHH